MDKELEIVVGFIKNIFTDKELIKKIFLIATVIIVLLSLNIIIAKKLMGGEDFFVHWKGSELLLKNKISPFSENANTIIQNKARTTIFISGKNNLIFISPIFSCLFYAPFTLIKNFEIARAIWMTILELSLSTIVILILKILEWTPSKKVLIIIIGSSLLNVFSVINIMSGDLIILVLLFTVTSYWLFIKNKLEIAGITLAFSMVMPFTMLLPTIFFFVLAGIQKKWELLSWYFITLGLLFLSSLLLLPKWPLEYIKVVLLNKDAILMLNPINVLKIWFADINQNLAYILIGLPLLILIVEWKRISEQKNKGLIFWAFCLTLLLGQLIWIRTDARNLILFLPAILCISCAWMRRNIASGQFVAFVTLFIFVAQFFIILSKNEQLLIFQNQADYFITYFNGIYLLINMYWIRGWIVENTPTFYKNKVIH